MKHINLLLSLAAVASLSACASFHATPVALQSIGPAPQAEGSPGREGYLVVYSAWSRDPSSNRHSRYTISTGDGSLNREIPNHMDAYDAGPTSVPLAPGAYSVSARCAHTGRVIVPVEIKKGATTYVYLDGTTRLDSLTVANSAVVRLPDGSIAGWAASK